MIAPGFYLNMSQHPAAACGADTHTLSNDSRRPERVGSLNSEREPQVLSISCSEEETNWRILAPCMVVGGRYWKVKLRHKGTWTVLSRRGGEGGGIIPLGLLG